MKTIKRNFMAICLFAAALLAFLIAGVVNVSATTDNRAVYIEINYAPYTAAKLPQGVVGKLYKTFDCSATDNLGNIVDDITVYVYDPNGTLLSITDGRFLTATAGTYTLLYVAKDSDVYARKEVQITVTDDCDELFYNIDESIRNEYSTGERIFVKDGTFGGGVGEAEITVSVTCGGEQIATENTADGLCFTPQKSGVYELSYTVKDFVGNEKKAVKNITVSDSDFPVLEEPSLAKSGIVGKNMYFPLVDGVLYADGKIYYCPVKVYLDDKDVTDQMQGTAETAGEHIVKYECANPFKTDKIAKYVYTVTFFDSNTEEMTSIFDNYFYVENLSTGWSNESNNYSAIVKSDGDAYFKFTSAIACEYLSLGVSAEVKGTDIGSLEVYLTDSVKENDSVKISLGNAKNFNGSYYFIYDAETNVLSDEQGKFVLTLTHFCDGRKFSGFESGKAYISCKFVSAKQNAKLTINSIGTQSLSGSLTDRTSPMFLTDERFASVSVADMGDEITIYRLKACDILDSDVKVTVTITDPDGESVFSGKLNDDYKFIATKYGIYNVKYVAKDSKNNKKTMNATVNVLDRIPPEIADVQINGTVKVGETLIIPAVSATDNATKECLTYVYVLHGNFLKELVYGDYTFESAGEYILRYVAYDDVQNYSVMDFKIICK